MVCLKYWLYNTTLRNLIHLSLATSRNSCVFCFFPDSLRHDVISGPSFFIKQSSFLITIATDLFSSLGSNIPGNTCTYVKHEPKLSA